MVEAITDSNAVIVRRNKIYYEVAGTTTLTTTNDRTGDFGIWSLLAPTDGDRSHDGLLPIPISPPNAALTCGTIVAESPPDALRGTQEFEQILPWRSIEQIAEPGKERSPIGASAVRPSSLLGSHGEYDRIDAETV